MLDDLIARVEAGEISAEDAAREAPLHRGDSVAVTIHLSENVDGVVDFLEDNGGSNISSGDDYIEAYVPVLILAETSEQPGVLRVRVIQPPESPQSQSRLAGNGPGVHGSVAWNRAGYSGQGIRVGVIDGGFAGFASLMGTEVPATVQARCYLGLREHTQDLEDCGGRTHGTAVAESVMDIAPDVSLYIANPRSPRELRDTVDWMVSEGVTIINHSMTWLFDGPGHGTSPSSISPLTTVDRAAAAGIVWVNAAGNQAQKTWFKRGPFTYSTISLDGEDVRVINFDGSDFRNQFHLWGPLQLRWDDAWGGATRDLDLFLARPGDDVIELASIDPQSGGDGHNPYELIIPSYALVRFDVLIVHISGSEPDWIQLLGWGPTPLRFNTNETGSIGNPAESANPGMLAVGAAAWDSLDTIRYYSSRGPTPDGRVKPDLVGADCGDTVAGDEPFCGTSQASPHVAGLAALVRQRFPTYTSAQVVSYLKDNSEQRTGPDPNNTWGHGFIVLPPNPPQIFGPPIIDSVTAGENSLTVLWRTPSSDGGSAITAYDLRHIETSADETVDSNWSVVEDVWTQGSGALSHELTGLGAGAQYDVQVRAVNSTGDGPWSTTVTGTPTLAETPCSTGGAVPNPHSNPALVADCDTLLAVRDTLAGSGTLNWDSSTPITSWDGVTVGGTPQRTTLLYLGHMGLSGTLPVELGSLTGLTQLSIFDTQLTGPIPPELGSLANLTHLSLFRNQLTGPVPAELGRLSNLQGLELWDNRLTGSIPPELGSLTNLEALHIDSNQLTGAIPPVLGNLTKLRWLTLHDNQLTGNISEELNRLTSLEQLYLSGNQFTGCVPAELRDIRETDRTHRLKDIGIPYCDVLLGGLIITAGELRPAFDPYVTSYTATAAAPEVTVTANKKLNSTYQYLAEDGSLLADADNAQSGHQVEVPVGRLTTIKVKVTTADGLETRTYTIQVTGLGALGAPSIRQVTSGINSLAVSWREPRQTGGSAVTAYDLRHIRSDASSRADSNWTIVQDVWSGSGVLAYDLTGLDGGVHYDVQVRAVNSAGDGPWSATVTIATKGTVAGAPTGLTAIAAGQTQIGLSWSAPLDTGASAVTGYRIETSEDGSAWVDLVANTRSAATSYSHSGLTAGSTRHYRVSAINSAGTGPASNVAVSTIGAASVPDLVVDTPTVSESAPAAGASITLSVTVRNQGNGPSDSTTLRYYQSADPTIAIGDREVDSDSVSRLNALSSGDVLINLTAPPTPGTYYLGACVDSVSGESDTTNNCSGGVTVTVGAAPAPDLVVDTPTVSDSAPAAGSRITLSATVRNQRNGSSAFTTLRYYRSADSTITTSDTEVGTDSVSRLDPSESGDESASLSVPSTPGTYYYGACVDSVSDESDTTNNCSRGVIVTVGAAPAPDLVVDTPTVSDSAPAAGASFTLSATVRNQGNGSSAITTLRYYRSADSTVTTSDREVGTDSVSRLDPSESGDESTSLTVPSTPRTYYYGACVDAVSGESDTGNNCSVAVTVSVGAAPTPDLVVGAPTVSDSSPTAGASFTLNATARNQGSGSAGSTTLRYYRSDDTTIATGDTEVGTDYVTRLDASESGDESVRLDAPSTSGTYYYGACVDAVSGESDTGNNCSVAVTVSVGAAPTPDLVVGAPTVSDSSPTAGGSFTLNATVRNQGSGRSDSTTLRYYQSTDSTITTGDAEIGTDSVFRLDASESGDESISLTAPSTPGTYYYGACVDAVPGESNTQNNCSGGVTVTVGAAPVPDLVVDTQTVSDSSPTAGASFTLNATVRNQGSGRSESTTLRYYQSIDSAITISDTEVGTDYVTRLDASESGDESVRLDAPSTSGTYYYGACVDSVSDESVTTNNCSSGAVVTVGAAPAPDLVVDTPTVSDSAPEAGGRITLTATVRNQGNGRSDSTTLRYYQSSDSTITTGDTVVGTDSVFRLDASESGDESIRLDAPSNPGTYYYGACVDSVSDESVTTNNCSSGVIVTVGAAPAPASVPGAPTGLTATANGQTQIDLSWSAPQDDGGTAITGYLIEVSADGSSWSDLVADTVSTITSYTSKGLSAGETRYYRVSAINSVGTSIASNAAHSTPATAGRDTGVPDLVVDNYNLRANLTPGYHWSPNATIRNQGDGSSAPTTLRYYRSTDSAITVSDVQVGTTAVDMLVPSASISDAIGVNAPTTPGTYYYGACVDAVPDESDTTNNCSSATEVTVRIVNSPPQVVGDVDDITVALGESFRVDISGVFSEPDGEEVGNYGFTLRNGGILTGTVHTVTGILNLTAIGVGVTTVAVDAADINGNGSGSHDLFVVTVVPIDTTSTATTPGAPTGMTATANGQTQIDLTWTAPSSDGGAAITGYKIEVSANGSSWNDLEADTGSTGTGHSHTGLSAADTRHYRVSAINSDGAGPASNTDSATTDSPPAATAPDAPTGLTATANGQTQIDLSWSTPSNDGGSAITGYRVEVSTDGSSWTNLVANTGSTYSHKGLTVAATRHYRVAAINSAGTSQASNVATATTDSTPTPSLDPDTESVTGSISECSGEQLSQSSDFYRMTITGTLAASRAVTNLRVIGYVDGTPLGTESIRDMAAGESVTFSITGTAFVTEGTCEVEFIWVEFN